MRGAMFALAGGCALIALAPGAAWMSVASVAGAWHPPWADPQVPASLTVLGRIQPALAFALVAAAGLLAWRARARRPRRSLTWDCGYAAPTARMQYTGGSFAQLAGGWFRFVLRPQRRLRRPHGLFPDQAEHGEMIPDFVLDGVVGPVSGVVMRASTFVRRLQHGRLPDYILYLVAGLAAVGAIVVFGGNP
jgi:hydrogenase-4 component B